MKISNNFKYCSQISFKGHEAKKLDSILVHKNDEFGSDAILKQLDNIARQHNVQVQKVKYFPDAWIQDEIYFAPNKKVFSSNYNYAFAYAQMYGLEAESLTNKDNPYRFFHVDGGNIFFVSDKDGRQVVLTAKDVDGTSKLKGQEDTFGVDEIIQLPRADYHADLFVTPIGDNKILVANDKLMLDGLNKMLLACYNFILKHPNDKSNDEIYIFSEKLTKLKEDFERDIQEYNFKGCDEKTAKLLREKGFEVIPVPSRIYNFKKWKNEHNRDFVTHLLNYSNSITFKNRKNETVLIAAKSGLEKELGLTPEISEKIGIDFEKLFIDAVKPHIRPNNVHFILGDKNIPISKILEEKKGGLHCMCVEVPDFYKSPFDF